MASVFSLFVFFLLSYLVLLLSAEPVVPPYNQNTCRPFSCRHLGTIGFPFANITQPNCGVRLIDCSKEPSVIQLGTDGRWYELTRIINSSSLQPNASYILGIRDRTLSKNFISGRCEFIENWSIPPSPLISLQILSPIPTFVKCNSSQDDVFEQKGSICPDTNHVYDFHGPRDSIPSGCSTIQLPVTDKQETSDEQMVPDEIEIKVKASDDCSECFQEGGKCQHDDDRKFYCRKEAEPVVPPYNQNTCRPFSCRHLGTIGFPFANTTHPNCGVRFIDCSKEPPMIQLGTDERWYELTRIINCSSLQPNASYILGIRDRTLSENFISGRCEFIENWSIPPSPLISLQILSPIPTFVKCNSSQDDVFEQKGSICRDTYHVYGFHGPRDSIPSGCSTIQLPVIDKQETGDEQMVPDEIEIKVKASDDCSECFQEGGKCRQHDDDRKFCCRKEAEPVVPPYNQNTCRPFSCRHLGTIGFPFANTTHPNGGVLLIDCSKEPPMIQLGTDDRWYELTRIINSSSLQPNASYILGIRDRTLSENFISGRCEFIENWSIPPSPLISLQILSPIPTFVKCNSSQDDVFEQKRSICRDTYHVYDFHGPRDSIPSGCSTIQLPVIDKQETGDEQMVPDEIEIKVKASDDCSECFQEGGKCRQHDDDRKFCCRKEDGHEFADGALLPVKRKTNKVLVIGLSVGCVIIIICLGFGIWRSNKKKNASSNFVARNTYAVQSSMSDVEGGSVHFGVHAFPYSELQKATNNFDDERELGDGGFGIVYYGKLHDGREVAVKRLYERNYRQVQQFINEVDILTRMRHKNLLSLYGCTSRRSRELLLVYEYIPNGTVADHIHGDRATPCSLPWPTRMRIAIEAASALAYLHASEIIHRDVKTNNILLDNNFCVKVADFGLSRLFPNDVTHVSTGPQGTPGYVDPEYRQCYQLTKKSDVYSFGVVLFELISSLPAVDITRHRHEINLANLAVNKIEQRASHELIDPHLGFHSDNDVKRMTISVASLAFQCIQEDKELRPSMKEVLEALESIQSDKEAKTNEHPPTSPDCDEVGLLKTKRLPPSPIAVTDNWTSRSSTPNISDSISSPLC